MLKPQTHVAIVDRGDNGEGIQLFNSKYEILSFIHTEEFDVITIILRDGHKYQTFYDLDDFYSFFIIQILKQEWEVQTRIKPSKEKFKEYENVKQCMINHYIYLFATLYDLMKEEGWPEEQIKKYSPRAYKYLMEYLNN